VEKKEERRIWIYRLVIAGPVQFVILTVVAMFIYPGGTYDNPATTRYQFFNNFFSDLGRTVAHNGQPNPVSWLLFTTALALAGLSLVVYCLITSGLLKEDNRSKWLGRAGSLFGVIAGLSYIGVAFTPADLYIEPHVNFVYSAFLSFFISVLFYLPAIAFQPKFPRWMIAIYGGFAIILGLYLVLLFGGPSGSAGAISIQATGQKIVVYAANIAMLFQGYGTYQVVRSDARHFFRSSWPTTTVF
jgi:hypothetical membrane protein